MPILPQHLLAGIVLASGVGGLAMCVLVLRYGFAAPPDDAGEGQRRETATRLGHAVAGACFAAAAILSIVLVPHVQRTPGGSPDGALVERDGVDGAMIARVTEVAERLAALESRMDTMQARVAPLDGRLVDTRERLGAIAARLERAPVESRVQEIETRLGPLERRLKGTETARVSPAPARIERAEARVSAIESLVRQHTDDLARAAARLRQLEEQPSSVPPRPAPAAAIASEEPRVVEPAPAGPRWIPAREAPAPPRGAGGAPPAVAAPSAAGQRPGSAPTRESAAVRGSEPAAPSRPPPSRAGAVPAAPTPQVPPDSTADKEGRPGTQLGEKIRDDWQTVRRGFDGAGDDLRRAVDSLRRNFRDTFGW